MMPRAMLALALVAMLPAGCRVPPPAPPPQAYAPAPGSPQDAYKELNGWRPSQPSDVLSRGAWWETFGDVELDALEVEVDVANQDVKAAEARFRAARAAVGYSRAAEYPTIGVAAEIASQRSSDNAPGSSKKNNAVLDYVLPFDLSYEIDLWGRVRRVVQLNREEAQAVAADLESVRLILHAELAFDYFQVRAADAQKDLLEQTVESYRKTLELTTNRFNEGAAPKSDVTQARTQLQSAIVADSDISLQRAQYEHAIALLVGKRPAEFAVAAAVQALTPPEVPTGLPSQLLERRPDIAAAERRVAEANEQIGLARLAYFPTLSLQGIGGYEGHSFGSWFELPSRIWAVGPALTETLFDAGRRRASAMGALANYDESAAYYRQTVLQAFTQVEDNLAILRILQSEAGQQSEATSSARESLELIMNRYREGASSYLQVLTAQTVALENERNEIDIHRRQMGATVLLIKALGGGWTRAGLPAFSELR